jgi:WhiB family transcriptional regulator, redox-sensing transcriptional regulator
MRATDVGSGWWSHAACQSVDPDLFFPISMSDPGVSEIAQAKAVCAKCAVRSRCLSAALTSGTVHGIWGGTTEEERQHLRRADADALASAGEQGPPPGRASQP